MLYGFVVKIYSDSDSGCWTVGATQGRQGSYCEQKNCLTMDFGYIHGKRAHFRVVIVAVSDF